MLRVGSGGWSSVGALAPPQRQARRFGLAREDGDGARVGGNTNAGTGRRAERNASGFALKREHGALPLAQRFTAGVSGVLP